MRNHKFKFYAPSIKIGQVLDNDGGLPATARSWPMTRLPSGSSKMA